MSRRPTYYVIELSSRWLTALVVALAMGTLARYAPETGAASVLHGQAYRDEMIRWIRTGGRLPDGRIEVLSGLAGGEEVITLTGHPNRPDPFGGKVKAFPLDFDEAGMTKSLQGVDILVNTYWVRFDKGENTQPRAVKNTQKLVNAAKAAGIRRMVHISIANPSAESHLPYYWGKAANEKAVIESGMPYAILRPTVLVGGGEDILINNIAFLLRRFPFFFIPGDALVDQRAHHRPARRPAHALPGDRRPGVQDHARVHTRDHIPGDTHAHQRRSALLDAPADFCIGSLDVQPAARRMQARHALHRRLPIQVDHRHTLRRYRLRHAS